MKKIVTPEWLANKVVQSPEKVIARALLAVYQFQTASEQACRETSKRNNAGFSQADANVASRCVEHFIKTGQLKPWMITVWMHPTKNGLPRICKYHRQLNLIAIANAKKSTLI